MVWSKHGKGALGSEIIELENGSTQCKQGMCGKTLDIRMRRPRG